MSNSNNLNKIFDEINKNLKNREFISAENNLKKILEKNPKNVKALFLLGSVYLELNQLNNSIKLLNEVIDLDPKISNAYSNLGIIYIKQRNFQKAKICILKSLEINPKKHGAVTFKEKMSPPPYFILPFFSSRHCCKNSYPTCRALMPLARASSWDS